MENMKNGDDLISLKAAIAVVHDEWDGCLNYDGSGEEIANYTIFRLEDLPSVPRKGKWVMKKRGVQHHRYECSCCKAEIITSEDGIKKQKYCYNCGVKMQDGDEMVSE